MPGKIQPPLICVVDDNFDTVRLLVAYLKKDYRVVSFKSGLDLISFVEKKHLPIDCFLIDLEMPLMDGFDLVRRIRGRQEFNRTPAIAITGHTDKAVDVRINSHGFQGKLNKPFKLREVSELMIKLLPVQTVL